MRLETFLKYIDNEVQITIIDYSCGVEYASTLVQPVYLGNLKFESYRKYSFYFVYSANIRAGILEIMVAEYGKE